MIYLRNVLGLAVLASTSEIVQYRTRKQNVKEFAKFRRLE